MLKGVCQFFNTTGKCRFGKHCRFAHIEISETPPPQVEINQDGILSKSSSHAKSVSEIHSSFISQQPGNNGSLSNQNQPSEGAVSPESNICTFYLKNRFCRYGKRCRYLHVPLPKKPGPKAPRAVTEAKSQDESQKEETQKTEGEKEVQNEIRELNDEFNKTVALPEKASPPVRQGYKKKVCHFFKQGHCKFGKRCQYFHPTGKQNVSDQPKKTDEEKSSQKAAEEKSESQTPQTVAPTFKPPHIQVYNRDTVSVEKLTELRETELRQLKRRFPKDKLEIVEEGSTLSKYTFTFTPTDPDWPYDVKNFVIGVEFPEAYPFDMLKLSLPVEQDLPETVRRYIEVSLCEWAEKKEQEFKTRGTVEMVFRPFLRWLDRNLQEIVTEGLRQLRRELTARAAGFQFVSAKELQKEIESKPSSDTDQSSQHSDDSEQSGASQEEAVPLVVYRKDQNELEEVYKGPEEHARIDSSGSDSSEEEEEDGNRDISKLVSPDTERKGTELVFRNMQLYYYSASILVERLQLTVMCERCKHKTEFSTPPNRINSAVCGKCHGSQLVLYRAVLAHPYSSTFGYLDLEGCVAFDINLQKSVFSITCMHCNKPSTVKTFSPGKAFETFCRGCHNRIKFGAESVKLTKLGTSVVDTSSYSGSIHKVALKKFSKNPKDPAIQEGKALPDNGACKHYKKSYRWLRFPCCGKCYPCDVCHDDNEGDHQMKYANRMICGFCCKEQPFAGDKPCVACSSALTKVHSTHWEGGKGCRNKITMSKTLSTTKQEPNTKLPHTIGAIINSKSATTEPLSYKGQQPELLVGGSDEKKYSNMNKTVSNKAKEKTVTKNTVKNTKLRHA